MILVEVGLPSYIVAYYDEEMNEQMRVNLDLIKEIQAETVSNKENNKRKTTKYFSKIVKSK